MDLGRVRYKNGRAYISRIRTSGNSKGIVQRTFGRIINCKYCGNKCFAPDLEIKRGRGLFCSYGCRKREHNGLWKGGEKNSAGRIWVLNPEHPFCNSGGYVLRYRLIVEKQIGRYLHTYEVVHHINKIKDDDREENLMAFETNSSHKRFEKNPCNIDSKNIIFDGRKSKQEVLNGSC